MSELTRAKLAQAQALLGPAGLDAWLVLVRETAAAGDPALPLICDFPFVWQSALLVTPHRCAAVVGSHDAAPLRSCGDWDPVVPYVEGLAAPLRSLLESSLPATKSPPRIGVNVSPSDVMADGLTVGMHRNLEQALAGTRFEGCVVSAEPLLFPLRSRKTPEELRRIRAAVRETQGLLALVDGWEVLGASEAELFRRFQAEIASRGFGYAWDPACNPIVNTGPDSAVGHTVPSDALRVSPGHLLHVDLGVRVDGYSGDLQRCWYLPRPGESGPPPEVQDAFDAVSGAISAAFGAVRPGVAGWEVDAAARRYLVARGYPEYQHATGHQVGRMAHDGGGILGPRWERYGITPELLLEPDQVYTLELGVEVPEHGLLSLEEMVVVTPSGAEWLSERQTALG